ncbi:FG-GAP-like repeat-containing protein [Calditrichota bacterium]
MYSLAQNIYRSLLFLILFIAIVSHSLANFIFVENLISDEHDGVNTVKTADMDDDGDMDIIISQWSGSAVKWLENDGDEDFTEHDIAEQAGGPSGTFIIDFDNDDDIDVVFSDNGLDRIEWCENDGDLNFTQHNIAMNFDGAGCPIADDLDNDGDNDIAGVAGWANEISWWENTGGNTFIYHLLDNEYEAARHVSSADIDSDDDIDLVSCSYGDSLITLWENDGDQEFFATNIADDFRGAQATITVDLDGDDDIDILGAAQIDAEVTWWENDGEQEFEEHTISEDFAGVWTLRVVDMDYDDDLDILGTSTDNLKWWENDGNGNFFEITIAEVFDFHTDAVACDLDSDDDMDVIAVSSLEDEIVWLENTGLANSPEDFSLVHPPDGRNVQRGNVVFRWEATEDEDPNDEVRFTFHLSMNEDFSESSISEAGTDTFYYHDLAPASNYWWKVHAQDLNTSGTWSTTWSFTTFMTIYEPENLDAQLDSATGQVSLSWGHTLGADLDEFSSFNIYRDGEIIGTSVEQNYVDNLETAGIFSYEVSALYDEGESPSAGPVEITWDGVYVNESGSLVIPDEYVLQSVYPNPFNPTVSIVAALPQPSNLNIEIYNVNGQFVGTIAKGFYTAGFKEFTFEAQNFSAGIYFIRATVPGKMDEMKRVILVK